MVWLLRLSRTCFVLRRLSLDCVGHSGGEVRWKVVIPQRLCRPTVHCCQTENEIQQTVKSRECLTYAIIRECSVLRRWGLACVRDSFWGESSKVSIAQYSDYIDSPVFYHTIRQTRSILSRPIIASTFGRACFVFRLALETGLGPTSKGDIMMSQLVYCTDKNNESL